MTISRSIAALMYQIIDVALSCVFDVTATLFSVSLSRRAIGRDLFPPSPRQNLPCSVSSAFNVFPSRHHSSHLSTFSRSMTLVSRAVRERNKHFPCNYIYARKIIACILPRARSDAREEVIEGQCGISNALEVATTVNVQFLVTHKLNDVLNSYLDVARGKERGWIMNPDTSFLR